MVKEALTEEASTRENNSPFGLLLVLFLFALLAIGAGLAGVIVVLSLVNAFFARARTLSSSKKSRDESYRVFYRIWPKNMVV